MSDNPFLRVSNLREFLGQERFDALLDLEGRDEIRDFCDRRVKNLKKIPNHFILGGKKYHLFSPFRKNEGSLQGLKFEKRALRYGRNLAVGRDDFTFLRDELVAIPGILRNNIKFVFPHVRALHDSSCVESRYYKQGVWIQQWMGLETHFDRTCRVLFEVKE